MTVLYLRLQPAETILQAIEREAARLHLSSEQLLDLTARELERLRRGQRERPDERAERARRVVEALERT